MKTATLYRSETWLRSWILTVKKTGIAVDLTGATATLKLRNSKKELVYTATIDAGLSINGPAGRVDLNVNETVTETWPPDTYTFKIRIVHSGRAVVYEDNRLVVQEY